MSGQILERKHVIAALEDAGLEQEALREDYSGRGMYGKECPGLVGSRKEFVRFYIRLAAQIGADEAEDLANAAREDSMGREEIVYWPGTELTA